MFSESLNKVKYDDLDLCKYELKFLLKFVYLKNHDKSMLDSEYPQSPVKAKDEGIGGVDI